MTWKRIGVVAGALIGIGTIAQAMGIDLTSLRPATHGELNELRVDVASNTEAIAFQEFKKLESKIDREGWRALSGRERRDYCKYAAILKFNVPQCR